MYGSTLADGQTAFATWLEFLHPSVVYFALLALCLPLLWPALRLRQKRRYSLLIVVGVGSLAALYELAVRQAWIGRLGGRCTFEIPLISVIMLCLYAAAAAILFNSGRRLGAAALTLSIGLAGWATAAVWIPIHEQNHRRAEVSGIRAADAFRAMFQSPEAYENNFGPVSPTADSGALAGHYVARNNRYYTRLVINAEGRSWLFYRCWETECHFDSADQKIQPKAGERGKWWTSFGQGAVRITDAGDGRLSLWVNGQTVAFEATPPPLVAAEKRDALAYLGAFSQARCLDQRRVALSQLWLWQGKDGLFGLGSFSTQFAGLRSGALRPLRLGKGRAEENGWSFTWAEDEGRRTGVIEVKPDGSGVLLSLAQDPRGEGAAPAPPLLLLPGDLFDGGIYSTTAEIRSAPGSSAALWERWSRIALQDLPLYTDVPACPNGGG